MSINPVIDLTGFQGVLEDTECIDVSFELDDYEQVGSSSDDFENEAKRLQELKDYELARSLQVDYWRDFKSQIAEYTNWNHEITNQTTVKRKKEDVVVEAVDIKLKKQKCEDEKSYVLNVFKVEYCQEQKRFIQNVLASELELIDPTPNISVLFEVLFG